MNLGLVEKIANAVLYEGYILYPYRPSAVKNQQRWNFGAICPRSYSEAQGGTEAWSMQTECLVSVDSNTTLDIKLRFLHLIMREVCELKHEDADLEDDESLRVVQALDVNGKLLQTWQEAVEHDVNAPAIQINEVTEDKVQVEFRFLSSREVEPIRDESDGRIAGAIVRRQQELEGAIEVSASKTESDSYRVTVTILNLTPLDDAGNKTRDDALMRSCVSTHTILSVSGGEFISLLDPPDKYREAAAVCSNIGTYPVLVGHEGDRDCMLSSPIILYDYPQIAPESAGELFDGTEIDEILTLRIMTLTDEEKREMRSVDERARQILERTERLPVEQLMKLHGVMRSLRPNEDNKR